MNITFHQVTDSRSLYELAPHVVEDYILLMGYTLDENLKSRTKLRLHQYFHFDRATIAFARDEDSNMVGIAIVSLDLNGQSLSLHDVAVLPKYQQRGIARKMLGMLIDSGQNHYKARNVYLNCDSDNEAAIGLYESLGFELVTRQSGICFYKLVLQESVAKTA